MPPALAQPPVPSRTVRLHAFGRLGGVTPRVARQLPPQPAKALPTAPGCTLFKLPPKRPFVPPHQPLFIVGKPPPPIPCFSSTASPPSGLTIACSSSRASRGAAPPLGVACRPRRLTGQAPECRCTAAKALLSVSHRASPNISPLVDAVRSSTAPLPAGPITDPS
jgi:hypothetical protein